MKKIFLKTAIVISLLLPFGLTTSVQAASLIAKLNVTGGCKGLVNGGDSASQTVTTGEDTNITVSNDNAVTPQDVSGPGIATTRLAAAGRNPSGPTSKTFVLGAVNSSVTLTFTPVPTNYNDPVFTNDCPEGSTPHASTLTITPVAPPPPAPTTSVPAKKESTSTKPTTTPAPTSTTETAAQPDVNQTSAKHAETPDTPQPTPLLFKIAVGSLALLMFVVAAACLMGLLPLRKYWKKLFGKKSVKRSTKRRKVRARRKK